ncbi:DEAD/DEAH box helicase family protein, partial [Hydrogenivirga sp. 128-5-R1-1]|uniref:DEAD/DEAH box helicase family protein n=1 Tax=Hydrogenivirga sp. 128-5-R1-1 TaxID=392423 RepID=UPI00015F2183
MAKNFYKELENSLILYDFLINKIGADKERFETKILPFLNELEITDFIKSPQQTKYFEYLTDLGLSIDEKYDRAIIEYTYKIRNQSKERKNLSLKYFQYLSLLFTEIFLDLLTADKEKLLSELNLFLEENKEKYKKLKQFEEKDLNRLAYWMATGSGKTIISHYNYFQIKKYFKNYNKIILITPNEGLSRQHYEELIKTGIKAAYYDGNKAVLSQDYEVLVIDINKIRLENEKVSKDDTGKTIFVDEFGNNNILLVDEGHKG